ncbi:ABC transporter substrate-binding protein [bacterium]|nr:ABC transporter substrate-binding protein [bacterium]
MKLMICVVTFLVMLGVQVNAATSVKVGTSPAISTAGIYLAKEKGFFKDQGLEVEVTVFNNSGAPMTVLLAKGEIDVGAGNLTAGLFNAISKGNKFKIVADKGRVEAGKEYIALMVRKDLVDSGKVKTLKDLKGLKVSLTSMDGLSQQIVLDKMLSSAGLTDKDITLTKLSYPEAVVALKTKAVDATITIEPYVAQALFENTAVNLASSQDFVPDQQSAAIFYSPKFAENKEAGTKFMVAYLKGVRLYNESLKNPELAAEVNTILKKYMPIENEQIWKNMIPVGLNSDGYVNQKSIESDLKWYHDKKFVETIPDIKEFVDDSFVKSALNQLDTKNKTKSKKKKTTKK